LEKESPDGGERCDWQRSRDSGGMGLVGSHVTAGRVVIGGMKCHSATECEGEGLCVGKRWRIATGSRIFHDDDVALARFRNATEFE
jgi:hypothetical protein